MIQEGLTSSIPKVIFLDFDGVLTDNKVYVDEHGRESVRCNRSDGLAFDALRKLNVPTYIISTEKNPVVAQRAKKLKVSCYQGVENKKRTVQQILSEGNIAPEHAAYIGNDINDLHAMGECAIRIAPSDSHESILRLATVRLKSKGGEGVLRELLESHFELDLVTILYPK